MENLECLWQSFPWDIFFFWLIPLLIVWLIMYRLQNKYRLQNYELQDRIEFLESELDTCRSTKQPGGESGLQETINKLKEDLEACHKAKMAAVAVGATGVTVPVASMSQSIKKDDLKIVEGIGPKIQELCHLAGIYSFSDLAEADAHTLKEILDAAGQRFKMHDPSTWPAQSALARDGKWDELKVWQDELNKGRE